MSARLCPSLPTPYQGIYAVSKHALEGYSESLDHEVRQFGIRVSLIEPGFTRTSIDRDRQVVCQLLAALRQRAQSRCCANPVNIAGGEDPIGFASVILEAITTHTPNPRLWYAGGRSRQAGQIRSLQFFQHNYNGKEVGNA